MLLPRVNVTGIPWTILRCAGKLRGAQRRRPRSGADVSEDEYQTT